MQLERGAVVERAVDLNVSGPTFSWVQMRSYDSQGSGKPVLGGTWMSINNLLKLVQSGQDILVIQNASESTRFTYSSGVYTHRPAATCD